MTIEKYTPQHIPFTDLYTSAHYERVIISDGYGEIAVDDVEIPFLVERLHKIHQSGVLIDLNIWEGYDSYED